MKINLITLANRAPNWISDGYFEYRKRLPKTVQLALTEIPLLKRSKGQANKCISRKESELILNKITPHSLVIALEVNGKSHTSEELASRLSDWIFSNKTITLLIGGPEGLSKECKQRADEFWSLSKLTLPHHLVRVIIAEQIYRAWTITKGLPYHK